MKGRCIVCNSALFKNPVFILRNIPERVQDLPALDELEKDKGIDLGLYQCSGCGLIQFDCDPVPYYRDSTRAGERSDALIKLRQNQYKRFIQEFDLAGKKIIEIGAGKGGFLRTLKDMKEYRIQEFGIENNPEFVRIAREKEGVNVIQGFIDDEEIRIEGAPFDGFFCFSYPARLIEPNIMLQGIRNNLVEGGVGIVMCISQEHISQKDGFFEVTRDLYAYYSKGTLTYLLEKNGFEVLEVDLIDPYVYAYVKKRVPLNLKKIWSNIDQMNLDVINFCKKNTMGGKKIAVWCAGHYSFTVLAMTNAGRYISYIIDNATFKQGKYAPASHVPIVSPSYFKIEPVDCILILGKFYKEEIVKEIRHNLSEKIKIAVMDNNGINVVNEED